MAFYVPFLFTALVAIRLLKGLAPLADADQS